MNRIVKIVNTNGSSRSVSLDSQAKMEEIRRQLTELGMMELTDYFICNGSKLEPSSEATAVLSQVLDGNILRIGECSVIGKEVTLQQFRLLSDDEKIGYFHQSQLTHGICITSDGVKRAAKSLFRLKCAPAVTRELVNTRMESSYAFSGVSREMNLITSNKASMALETPYVNAKSEYEHEKAKQTSSTQITEFLLSKFMVAQAEFHLNPSDCEVNPEFVREVQKITESSKPESRQMAELVQLLNVWGIYFPQTFVMGGALYTSDEKSIREYQQSEADRKKFSAAAQAAFSGFGTGFEYDISSEEKESSSSKEEFKNLHVEQIGGVPGNIGDNTEFAKTLSCIDTWDMIDIREFCPSILLLKNAKNASPSLLYKVLNLMNGYYYTEAVKTLQPYIRMLEYATSVEEALSPF